MHSTTFCLLVYLPPPHHTHTHMGRHRREEDPLELLIPSPPHSAPRPDQRTAEKRTPLNSERVMVPSESTSASTNRSCGGEGGTSVTSVRIQTGPARGRGRGTSVTSVRRRSLQGQGGRGGGDMDPATLNLTCIQDPHGSDMHEI